MNKLALLSHLLARAIIRADGISANVLAPAVVRGALVLVGEEDGGEAGLLHGVVRVKLDPEAVALGGDDGREAGAAEEAVLADLAVAHLGGERQGVVLAVLLEGREGTWGTERKTNNKSQLEEK